MALVRKTDKLKTEIHTNINETFFAKVDALIKKHDIKKVMEQLLDLAWHNHFLVPAEVYAWLAEVDAHELSEMVGFTPPKIAFILHQATTNGWDRMATSSVSYPYPLPVVKTPRMLYASENGSARMAYTAAPQYDELVPYLRFRADLKLPSLQFVELKEDGTWKMELITAPTQKGMYNSTPATPWDGLMSEKMEKTIATLPSTSLTRKPFNAEMLDLCMAFDRLEEDVIAAQERAHKTMRYIFGELWKLPSLNKMYEFFPAIRAYLKDDTQKRLEKGGRKRPTYNISMPDDDVLVGATEASIRK